MYRIVVAPDKFKGTLTAAQAAGAMAGAVKKLFPDAVVNVVPMADGGEGTADMIGRMRNYRSETIRVNDALMREADARVWFSSDHRSAVIDSSAVIGLGMIDEIDRNPWKSTSFGLGAAVCRLVDSGIAKVEIGIGGTASVDAGIGFLQGLGARIFTPDGELRRPVMACDLNSITRIDIAPVMRFRDNISGISDVDVPLYDTDGYPSMLMFAPQKGVDDSHLIVLSMALEHLIERVEWMPAEFIPEFECRFGGAGGGLGFALAGVLGSNVAAGAGMLVGECGILNPRPALVLTGEGRFDAQSLTGKLTGTILKHCIGKNIDCRVIAGSVAPDIDLPNVVDSSVYPPCDVELTHEVAFRRLYDATAATLRNWRSPEVDK